MQNYIIGFETHNEQLCKLRKGKYNNITLINPYPANVENRVSS